MLFTVKTVFGEKRIKAFALGRGLFLHRHLDSPVDWKISAKCGYGVVSIIGCYHFHTIVKNAQILKKLDWNKVPPPANAELWRDFNQKPYKDLIVEFKREFELE